MKILSQIKLKYLFVLFLIFCFSLAIGIRVASKNWKAVSSDGFGYYVYLPQILKYQDIEGKTVLNYLEENEKLNAEGRLLPLENGNILNKYPIGEAIMLAPFFIIADVLNTIFIHNANYFEGVYSIFVSFAGLFYLAVGSFFLYKILQRFLSSTASLLTILLIVLGTNLLHYSTFDVSFSHVYSFCLFSIFTYFILQFKVSKYKFFYWALLGALLGLILAVRQTNVIVGVLLIYPVFNEFKNLGLKNSIRVYFVKFIIFILCAFLFFLPQIVYWYIVTGSPVISSYSYNAGESFNFLYPEFGNVLFSSRKGLFFWTPILLLTIPGFILMFRKKTESTFSFLFVIFIQIFIVSTWWAWSYGFSFGHRAFTEFLVFFSIPLGFTIEWLLNQKKKKVVIIALIVFAILVFINLFQMQQYWRGLLHPDGMTLESYIKIFMQPCIGKIEFLRCDWL